VSSNQQDSPTASDDDFHTLSSDPWETETCWFSFNVPEHNLAGWLYAWVRPKPA